MELAPGTRIDRYVLLEPLGQGGQGSVWKVEDQLHPELPKALKLVAIDHSRPADAERVRREARALTRLEHPSLVRSYGLFEDLRRDLLGVTMELVDGSSLRHVRADPRFGETERAALLRHIARTLAYVHDEGIVHRDLKPDNILVSSAFFDDPEEPSNVKLVDFGIAAVEDNPQPLTAVNSVIGTLAYLAPEVVDPGFFKAKSSRPAVDVFAFGVLAWQLLTDSPHPTGLVRATLVEYGVAYRRAAELGDAWPEQRPEGPWGELLERCLAVDADNRIQNGTELSASCDLASRSGAIVRPEPAPGSLPGSMPTAVASPGAMVGHTAAEAANVPRRSQAPTEQLATGHVTPPGSAAPAHDASGSPPPTTPTRQAAAPAPRKSRALALVLGAVVLAGAGAAVAVFGDLAPTGSRTGQKAAPPAHPLAAPSASAIAAPGASASAAPPDASAAPLASSVPEFAANGTLPINCDHDAGICACCPSGRDCSPGVCGDSLGVDQSWLLRAGPVLSDEGQVQGAVVCVQVKGLGAAECTSAGSDGGQSPPRIHVDTSDLLDRGIVVEVRAAGQSARSSLVRYDNGLKHEVLCTGLRITGFEGQLQVNTVQLYLDPDGASPGIACPEPR